MYRSAGPLVNVIRTRLTAGRIDRWGDDDVRLSVAVWAPIAPESLAPSPVAMSASIAEPVILSISYHFGARSGEWVPRSRTSVKWH